jgi:hypothetical protein
VAREEFDAFGIAETEYDETPINKIVEQRVKHTKTCLNCLDPFEATLKGNWICRLCKRRPERIWHGSKS